MRIGLDARYVYDHFPGIGRYTMNLAYALAELERRHELVVLYNPELPNTRHNLEGLRRFPGVELVSAPAHPFTLAEQVQIPRLVHALKLDVFHSPYYIKPYINIPCPSIVTIHDVIGHRFPRTLPRHARPLFGLTMWLAVQTSSRIITVSKATRDDIAYYYRRPRERIAVTPEATERRFRPQPPEVIAAVRAKYRLPPHYVLYVGSNKPHKNLERLVRAWERVCVAPELRQWMPGVTLVIAGHYDPRYPEAWRLVEERGLTNRVLFRPNVADADLPALYSGAEVFAFPSYYEGFGLPPLEAMACGTPVMCAYASSLPEVVGNAALTVDPYSFIDMAENLRYLLRTPGLRAYLRERGLRRAREFSWRRTAQKTLFVYEEVMRTAYPYGALPR